MVAGAKNITHISIYLIDSSDSIPSIYAFISSPRIDRLNLWFERRSEIVSFLFIIDVCTVIIPDLWYMYYFSPTGD